MGWRLSTEAQMQFKSVASFMEFGKKSPEYVALILGNYWFELDNEAEDPHGAFEVSDAVVRDLMKRMSEVNLDLMGWQPMVWHSHIVTNTPSEHDIEHFPEWCSSGLIFHVPSQTTLAYTRDGLVDPAGHIRITPELEDALATPEDVSNG